MEIVVYGPGCSRCKETEKRVRDVVQKQGVEAVVRKSTDIVELAKTGVLTTPAVTVNGVVKASGRIPSLQEIHEWISPTAA
ncbi:MAG: thioredoxin family protein [Acidobacteriia bacterium]|nr:thioredoxin family protein [Terriglobia bacterium]